MKIINFKFFFTAAFILAAGIAFADPSWQWISGQRVQSLLKEGSGMWLIDVRSQAAYENFHIEGSVNIPTTALNFKQFSAQKMLVLVDDVLGQREARGAADRLVRKGNQRVSVLQGGLASWKSEGLPLEEKNGQVRTVTADELKWALAHSVQMKIYDLRNEKDSKQGTMANAELVQGKSVPERVEKLRNILANAGKKKGLEAKIKKTEPVVLIFSASDDSEGYTRKLLLGMNSDVRYLIGGYEATVSDKLHQQQTLGACPTCPGTKPK